MSKKYYEFRPDDEVAQPSDVTSDTSHLKSEGVANQYSSTSAYAVGDFCMYEGKAYMCNTAIASPGETWTAAHWTLANLSSLFTSANTSNNAENVRVSAADATPIATVIAGKITNPSGGSAGNVLKKTADGVEWGTGGGGGTTIQYDSQTGRYYFET